jgi:hypothetical protein
LNDEELSRLASQCRQVESDISAGSLSNQEITYILIALATAVIIVILLPEPAISVWILVEIRSLM